MCHFPVITNSSGQEWCCCSHIYMSNTQTLHLSFADPSTAKEKQGLAGNTTLQPVYCMHMHAFYPQPAEQHLPTRPAKTLQVRRVASGERLRPPQSKTCHLVTSPSAHTMSRAQAASLGEASALANLHVVGSRAGLRACSLRPTGPTGEGAQSRKMFSSLGCNDMLNDPHVYIVIPLCRHTRINAFILVVANDCLPQKRLVSCQQHLQLFRHMKILQLADLAVCRTLCHTSIRRFWNNIIRPSKGRFYSPGPVPKRVPHVLCLFSGLFGR